MNSVHEKPGGEKFFGGAFPKDKDACALFRIRCRSGQNQ